jgi:hypothetical protein
VGKNLTLTSQGKLLYDIEFDNKSATPAEITAFNELKHYLGQITGCKSKIDNKKIILGKNKHSRNFFGDKLLNSLGKEEFVIKSDKNGNIFIVGGRPRGTLYGVYYFLDNILGIHWYTPEYTFIPKRKNIILPPLNINEKPAFKFRRRSHSFGTWALTKGIVDPTWAARNKLNNNGSIQGKKESKILDRYGKGVYFAPPYPCHALFLLIPPQKYFKQHPEWWALQDGKRKVYGSSRGVNASYCLSNEKLASETAKNVVTNLRKFPDSPYVNISEGDHTISSCECPKCQALLKKFGNKESGLWIYFANKVAKKIKKEFPKTKIVTFAYTRTAQPPKNIKADDNVTVWLCAWAKDRGLPYADKCNINGRNFVDNILLPWSRICKDIIIWDYVVTYNNVFQPQPDLLVNIDNMKMFKKAGVTGMYPQGLGADINGNGMPFKAWLLARAMWNPDKLDGNKLLSQFCKEYYGKKAGKYIYQYWAMLRNVNLNAKYYKINQAGWLGKAPHASLKTMLKADNLFRKAIKAAKDNSLYLQHVKLAYLPVQYMFIQNWKDWNREAKRKNIKLPDSLDLYCQKAIQTAKQDNLYYNEAAKKTFASFLKQLKKTASTDFIASASKCYGACTPYYAFDGKPDTRTSFGGYWGWLKVEFPAEKNIKRITTVISKGNILCEYEITGSLDGHKWFKVVPRRIASRPKGGTWMTIDDKLESPIKVKFLKTTIFRICNKGMKRSWTGIREQMFNSTKPVWTKMR